MPRHAAPADARSLPTRASDAQENQEPAHARVGAQFAPGVPDAAVKVAAARPTGSSDPGHRKHRRALHAIDSNRLPASCPAPSAAKRAEASEPPSGVKARLQPAQPRDPRVDVDARTPDDQERSPATHAGVKREAAAAAEASPAAAHAASSSEAQSSENLAWMDMMLALLEKRYGPGASVPVSVADLEAARMLPPQRKRRKTGDTGAARSPRRQQDAARQSRTSLGSRGSGPTATRSESRAVGPPQTAKAVAALGGADERDKTREEKRERVLLRHALQVQASSVSSSTCCGCKTGCLKMYCVCFSSRGFCHASCACEDCRNTRVHEPQRLEAIQSYLANDPRAFSYAPQTQDAGAGGFLHLLPQKSSAVVLRGCRCKKSKCLKKYCDCFQNGLACSAHCRCVACANHSASASASATSRLAARPQPAFHAVQLSVTKQPRRNRVLKTLRLNL